MAQCPMRTPTRDQRPQDPPPSRHISSNPACISPLSLPEFFKFKGFGSLSSIPRAFILRRVSVAPSSSRSLGSGLPPPHGFLEEPFDGTQDDLNTMPKSPGPYARSSDMYSHMGTMPRLNLGKAGKGLGKAKTTQTCREKDTTSDKTPRTALLPDPESPETFGSPKPGMDTPSEAGKAEQEGEAAQPVDTPGAVMATMDQQPVGNVSCPGTGAPSSSLAPNPSQTLSPNMAEGSETTDGDLPDKGQEHPGKSSSDRYGPIESALPSTRTPFLAPQGKRRVQGHSGVPAVSPLPAVLVGCTWPAGCNDPSALHRGQVSGSMGARFPVGFLLPPVSGQAGNISQPRSAPVSLCPAGSSIPALGHAAESSDLHCPDHSSSHSPLFLPLHPSPPPQVVLPPSRHGGNP